MLAQNSSQLEARKKDLQNAQCPRHRRRLPYKGQKETTAASAAKQMSQQGAANNTARFLITNHIVKTHQSGLKLAEQARHVLEAHMLHTCMCEATQYCKILSCLDILINFGRLEGSGCRRTSTPRTSQPHSPAVVESLLNRRRVHN